MAGPVGGLLAVDPHRHDHVETLIRKARKHGGRASGVIRRVAVDQEIDVGIHVGEHPSPPAVLPSSQFSTPPSLITLSPQYSSRQVALHDSSRASYDRRYALRALP